MSTDRPPRCRPLPPHVVEAVPAPLTTSRAELLDRLDQALAALPADERAAVIAAHCFGEGAVGVAVELGLETEDAEALARSALQLLRAALADLEG